MELNWEYFIGWERKKEIGKGVFGGNGFVLVFGLVMGLNHDELIS